MDIERLVRLIASLPAHGRVALHMRDGTTVEGVVAVRSSAQVFRDPQQREGTNAVVSLERLAGQVERIWLDQVERVQNLDPALATEN